MLPQTCQPNHTTVITTESSAPVSNLSTYYGLLEPDCSWGITDFGSDGDHRIVLFGHEGFLRRNTNLFASFGQAYCSQHVAQNVRSVTVTKSAMMTAFRRYLYGQLFIHEAKTEVVRDEDGDVVDTTVLNEEWLEAQSVKLAEAFVASLPNAYAYLARTNGGGSVALYALGSINAENPTDFS